MGRPAREWRTAMLLGPWLAVVCCTQSPTARVGDAAASRDFAGEGPGQLLAEAGVQGDTSSAADPVSPDCPPATVGFGPPPAKATWISIGGTKASDGDIDGPMDEVTESYPLGLQAATQLPDGRLVLLHGTEAVNLRFSMVCGSRLRPLAGNGMPGFRDGPAEQAMFSFARPWHYNLQFNLDADSEGTIYFTDLGNGRIRTLRRDGDGRWMMGTAAGGGTKKLEVGESAAARAVDLKIWGGPHLALASDDLLWIVGVVEIYRFTPADGMITRIAAAGFNPSQGITYSAAGDHAGNAYILTETGGGPCQFWRLAADGTVSYIAGTTGGGSGPYAGPPDKTHFHTVPGFAVLHKGRYLYTNGGDSTVMRRVPVDGKGSVEGLRADGTWAPMEQQSEGWQNATAPLAADRKGGVLALAFTRFWPAE